MYKDSNVKQSESIFDATQKLDSLARQLNRLANSFYDVGRFDYEGNQLFVGDIVESEDYFYRIGSLCSEFDKEYVTYLNLDGTESETNYASYCTKLTYEHYEELKSDYLTFLSRLEEVYKLVQIETWEEWESLQGKVDLFNNK